MTQKTEGALSGVSEVETAALVLLLKEGIISGFGPGPIFYFILVFVPSLSLSHP